jgi:ferritin-like metal-binding protein YciE
MKNTLSKQERTTRMTQQSDKPMNTELHELFLEELADVYDAEKQLTKALPKLAKAAQSVDLRSAFESHLEETKNHVTRLEQIAESLGERLPGKPCKAMQGLIEEGSDLIEEENGSSALDAGLIAAAQKVEHYEIASYGSLAAWAKEMGHEKELSLLQETLDEEKAADMKLTDIAETEANARGE